jgi:hypothetical protein
LSVPGIATAPIPNRPQKGGDDMEITVVKVERIEATLRHMTEYELA